MQILRKLDDEKNGSGAGPTMLECQFYGGHTGVSVDGGSTILGFNPNPPKGVLMWQLMNDLKQGRAFDGIVADDTALFAAAQSKGLQAISFEIRLSPAAFEDFTDQLDSEQRSSKYKYGFPNGDGDCNCTTWLERLGLPLLTGRMNEAVALPGIAAYPSRRFGECV